MSDINNLSDEELYNQSQQSPYCCFYTEGTVITDMSVDLGIFGKDDIVLMK